MKKGSMNMHNARDKAQLARMQRLKNEKRCFFCGKNYTDIGAAPAVYESPFWYIKKNDYPYKGSVHHYLIVPKTHISSLSGISGKSWSDLLKAIEWLEKKLRVKGYSIFARSGDMHYTGATINHLHFHFLTGVKSSGPSNLKDNILVSLGHKKK